MGCVYDIIVRAEMQTTSEKGRQAQVESIEGEAYRQSEREKQIRASNNKEGSREGDRE